MNEISINISIAGRKYPITIAQNEEQNMRAISKMINERMQAYSEQFSLKDNQDALAMFALELATDYQKVCEKLVVSKNQTSKQLLEIEQMLDSVQL